MSRLINVARAAAISVMFVSGMALATPLPPGSDGVDPEGFEPLAATQGVRLDFASLTGTTGTFSATVRSAVYRNTLGTLDFYYQVSRLGPGTAGDDLIKTLTATSFGGFDIDAYRWTGDPDGAGEFLERSGNLEPITTLGRTPNGNVPTISFALPGQAGIGGTDTTSTYVFRTDATLYGPGFWSIQDGTSLSGSAFAPLAAVPEPASWMMMIGGFGLIGLGLRSARQREAFA
jgi:hypothetical protein